MRFLNSYKKFFEQQQGEGAPAAPAEEKKEGSTIPEWFVKSYKSATNAKTKEGKSLALDMKDMNFSWRSVERLSQFSGQKFTSVKQLQDYLWSKLEDYDCLSSDPGIGKITLRQKLDEIRKSKGLPPATQEKFCDDKYGVQTNEILYSVICLEEGIKLSKEQEAMAMKKALPGSVTTNDTQKVVKPVEPGQIAKKQQEEGETGLSEQDLSKRAQTIIKDSLIPDETESTDKFKLGQNKIGARIVYKDKGSERLSEDDLAILDEYFGKDGFVRTKSKEKGGFLRAKFMKYVWTKKLNPKSTNVKPTLDEVRQKKEAPNKPAPAAANQPVPKPNKQGGVDIEGFDA